MDSSSPDTSTFQKSAALLALVALPVFVGALDLTIVSAVLPKVLIDFQIPFLTGADDAAWVLSGYLLAYSVSVVMMGRLSDLIGRRRTFFIALLIFILGSWIVAVAPSAPADWMRRLVRLFAGGRPDPGFMALYAMIAGRVIQAFGAGAMVPVSMALVGDLFPAGQRATPLGVIAAVDTAGWVLGHLYGGLMVQIVKWPVLFWINIPLTTAVAALTWRRLRPIADRHDEGGLPRAAWIMIAAGLLIVNVLSLMEIAAAIIPTLTSFSTSLVSTRWLAAITGLAMLGGVIAASMGARRVEANHTFDLPGAILIAGALTALNVALGGGAETQAALPPYAWAVLILAAILFGGFIFVERRSPQPLLSLDRFRERNVSLAVLINLLVGFCLMVGLVSVPIFVNGVIEPGDPDRAALISGIILGALTIPLALASIPGGLLTSRFGYRIPTVLGMVLAAGGFFVARTWTPGIPAPIMSLHLALAGIGLGLTLAPMGATVVDAASAGERGIASSLVLVMRLIGMTIGASIMTTYGLHRSVALTEYLVSYLTNPNFSQLAQIATAAATIVINEMMIIAAIVCLVAILPAVFLRPRLEPGASVSESSTVTQGESS